MKAIVCDKCKKIIVTGKSIRLEYHIFKPCAEKEDGIKYSKLIPNEMDLCDDCFKNLVAFLGME